LENALEYFGQQRYDMIITLFQDCPPQNFPDNDKKIMGYELFAQAYFYIGQVDSVKSVLKHLLDLQPNYTVQPPQYSEEFIKIVGDIKKERSKQAPKSIFRNRWFLLGGSTIVAAVVTAAMVYKPGNGDGKAVRLPDPPIFPGNK